MNIISSPNFGTGWRVATGAAVASIALIAAGCSDGRYHPGNKFPLCTADETFGHSPVDLESQFSYDENDISILRRVVRLSPDELIKTARRIGVKLGYDAAHPNGSLAGNDPVSNPGDIVCAIKPRLDSPNEDQVVFYDEDGLRILKEEESILSAGVLHGK
jgi:hypothetical protein